MSGVDQRSLAVLAMTNRLIDAGVPPLKAAEVWQLLERIDDPSTLFGLDERSASELTPGTGVEPGRLVRLLDAGLGLAVRLEALYERGISAVTVCDERFPRRLRERLGTTAPPVLYCAGELSLLGVDGIGMVGSRDVGPEAVEVTRKVANQVAATGLPVISGGAKGVDSISMAAAHDAGGSAVGVLADSLERALGHADNRRAMLDGRACLCTPYRPDARFTTGSAMGRNKLVYGLSRVTLVVASAEGEGGTWSGAMEALKRGYGRVAVWMGPGRGPGNDALLKAGSVPVEQPEAILDLEAVGTRDVARDSQLPLEFDSATVDTVDAVHAEAGATPTTDADPSMEPEVQTSAPLRPPPAAIAPEPTGICWCGCGKQVEDAAFFLPRHAPGAAQRAVVKHFGSVEAFLATLGELPTSDQP